MRKYIIGTLIGFCLSFAVGAHAEVAGLINGDYKGNPIVKVTSNGKLIETDEVPAQIYDGHTLVPIALLRQLGLSVTWDAAAYSVDVKLNGLATDSTNAQTIQPNSAKVNDGFPDTVEELDISISSFKQSIHANESMINVLEGEIKRVPQQADESQKSIDRKKQQNAEYQIEIDKREKKKAELTK